jgi:hypothetical protein
VRIAPIVKFHKSISFSKGFLHVGWNKKPYAEKFQVGGVKKKYGALSSTISLTLSVLSKYNSSWFKFISAMI